MTAIEKCHVSGIQHFRTFLIRLFLNNYGQGRNGKGVIHVVPVGNRGNELYMCGSNVMLQSIYTIGVTGSEYDGMTSVHSEYCASVMVTAYSSFGTDDKYMTVRSPENNSQTLHINKIK